MTKEILIFILVGAVMGLLLPKVIKGAYNLPLATVNAVEEPVEMEADPEPALAVKEPSVDAGAEVTVENLLYSDYRGYHEVRSRIDAYAVLLVEDKQMTCPRCHNKIPAMEHGEQRSCRFCGLTMELYGNNLECSMHLPK